jgi:hypothetical protein
MLRVSRGRQGDGILEDGQTLSCEGDQVEMNWSAMAFVGFFVVVGVLGLVVVLFISYAMAS